jgi:hypothetical protein
MSQISVVPETPAAPKPSDADLRRQAYNAAEGILREKYRDEFLALVKEQAAKRGVTYEPRKTAKEKAADKMAALLAEFPDLAPDLSAKATD